MESKQIETIAKDYMRQLGFCENTVAKLQVKFRNNRRRLGTCYVKQRMIVFTSNKFSMPNDWWLGLIAHEVAHFKARRHGKRFREVLAMLNQGAITQFGTRKTCKIENLITAGIEQTFSEVKQ